MTDAKIYVLTPKGKKEPDRFHTTPWCGALTGHKTRKLRVQAVFPKIAAQRWPGLQGCGRCCATDRLD